MPLGLAARAFDAYRRILPRPIDLMLCALLMLVATERSARADLTHDSVSGTAIGKVTLRSPKGAAEEITWADLASPKAPGVYAIQLSIVGGYASVLLPHCNGREKVLVDGATKDAGSKGPLALALDDSGDGRPHEVTVEVKASTYEKRIACSEPPRVGALVRSADGLGLLRFRSPHKDKGGGEAVV